MKKNAGHRVIAGLREALLIARGLRNGRRTDIRPLSAYRRKAIGAGLRHTRFRIILDQG